MQIIKGILIALNVLATIAMGYCYASVKDKSSRTVSAIMATLFIANTAMII